MITNDNDEPVWISKGNPLVFLIPFLLGGIAFGVVLVSDWNTDFLSEKYLPLDNGIVFISIILLVMCLAYLLYNQVLPEYKLYGDRLVISRKRKPDQTFYLSDLENWRYTEGKSRSGTVYIDSITFCFHDKKINISSLLISKLNLLRDYLLAKKPDQDAKEGRNVLFSIGVSIVFTVLFAGPILAVTLFGGIIEKTKGTEKTPMYQLTLSEAPRFIAHAHKHSPMTYEMRLKVQQIKDFDLMLPYIGHEDEKDAIEQRFHKGDNIGVLMLQHEYETKIIAIKEPSFLDKHFGWQHIHIDKIYY